MHAKKGGVSRSLKGAFLAKSRPTDWVNGNDNVLWG